MIIITQLIYIIEGEEAVFDEFEKQAIPMISKYNGKLLIRLRPGENDFIELHMERPYEIHLVEFESLEDFENFKNDKNRQSYLHLKERSVRTSILIQGNLI